MSVSTSPSPKYEPATANNTVEQRDRAENRGKIEKKEESVQRSEQKIAEAHSRVNVTV
ncbi:MAG: hypothetical protein HZA04_05075 [Nitrospinae bacterium]|nr:hypothetical protein [Nitrospinota bacterium]